MPDEKDTRTHRVIIIDDNPDIYDDFRMILQPPGDSSSVEALRAEILGEDARPVASDVIYELDAATQGREGYEKIKRAREENQPYSLAFVDIRMPPGWDGLETVENIWPVDPDIQIVICTAYSDHSWEDIAERLGAVDRLLILKKPYDYIEVAQLASALTTKWELAKQAAMKMTEMDRIVEERTKDLAKAHKGLKESEERFRTLVEHAADAIFTHDLEGRLLDVNQWACHVLGYSRDELLTMKIQDLVAEEASEEKEHGRRFWENLQPDRPVTFECAYASKDCRVTPVEVRISRIQLTGQKLIFALARDITERKKAQEQRREIELQAQRSQKMESLNVMAESIAHNFNNLLHVVIGHHDFALSALPPDSKIAEYLRKADRAAKNAAELSTLMLTYVGYGKGAVQSVNITELIEDISELVWASAPENVAGKSILAPNLPEIHGFPDQLNQLVMNLVTNATEAIGDENGSVIIETGEMACDRAYLARSYVNDNLAEGRYVFIEVKDDGCGMDDEVMSRIFDPYFSTKFIGRGLGLAAVLGIVRRHKGAVIVNSEPGKGATVRVLFPAMARMNDI
ncbi:MAG: PAS domain S-box protein [Desulfobacterales bacterium]|nr:PAS domain S-box protein [Desulfobacterales bacterium]